MIVSTKVEDNGSKLGLLMSGGPAQRDQRGAWFSVVQSQFNAIPLLPPNSTLPLHSIQFFQICTRVFYAEVPCPIDPRWLFPQMRYWEWFFCVTHVPLLLEQLWRSECKITLYLVIPSAFPLSFKTKNNFPLSYLRNPFKLVIFSIKISTGTSIFW